MTRPMSPFEADRMLKVIHAWHVAAVLADELGTPAVYADEDVAYEDMMAELGRYGYDDLFVATAALRAAGHTIRW